LWAIIAENAVQSAIATPTVATTIQAAANTPIVTPTETSSPEAGVTISSNTSDVNTSSEIFSEPIEKKPEDENCQVSLPVNISSSVADPIQPVEAATQEEISLGDDSGQSPATATVLTQEYLGVQQRYKILDSPTPLSTSDGQLEVRVLDCQPFQKSPIEALMEQQQGIFKSQSAPGVEGDIVDSGFLNAVHIPAFAQPYCLRYWEDGENIGQKDIYRYVTQLRKEFPFVENLNSTACQQACERTWTSILKFYTNCKNKIRGKKGYPKYSKRTHSVEFKQSGWKLNRATKKITFTDKKNIGELKLVGKRDLDYFQIFQINRVRIVKRADGYFCQFLLKLDVRDIVPQLEPTKQCVGIDVGLKYFYADSNGQTVDCPKYYRKAEKRLNKLNRRKSKKFKKGQKPSNNYIKARIKYAKGHLKVSRQRVEFAKEKALRLIQSNDLIAYEDLKVKNLVKNQNLAKSINDAAWSQLRKWIEYFGVKYSKLTIAVTPHYTSQECFNCGKIIKKSLSVRTHVCECGYCEDRDINAALNILKKATIGHIGSWSQDYNASGDSTSTFVGEILLK
jgi:putative transposase